MLAPHSYELENSKGGWEVVRQIYAFCVNARVFVDYGAIFLSLLVQMEMSLRPPPLTLIP